MNRCVFYQSSLISTIRIRIRWASERASEWVKCHTQLHARTQTRPHIVHTQPHTLHISYFDPVTIFADFQSCFSSSNNNHRDDSSFSFSFYEPKTKINRKPSVQRGTKIWTQKRTQRKRIFLMNPSEINCARKNSNGLMFSEMWTNTIGHEE